MIIELFAEQVALYPDNPAVIDEEGTLTYRWFSDAPGSYTVLEEYADADASAAHNKAGRELLAKLNAVATIASLDIYGELNDRLKGLVEALPAAKAHSEAI